MRSRRQPSEIRISGLGFGVLLLAGCAVGSRPARQDAERVERVALAPFRYDGTNPQGHDEYVRVKDGARMVFVPGGAYPRRPYDGTPVLHEPEPVDVPGFLIDKDEVTNRQFARFLNETGQGPIHVDPMKRSLPVFEEKSWGIRRAPDGKGWEPRPGYANHPAVGVTGFGAELYARWAGADLPDPDQWMKAAGGTEGRLFACAAPAGEVDPEKFPATACNWYGAGFFGTAPVGSFPDCVSPVGCRDMAGNVYERVKAPGPRQDRPEMLKGGSWVTAHPLNLRVHDLCMQPMRVAEQSVGFRCVVPGAGLPEIAPSGRRPVPGAVADPASPGASRLAPPEALILSRSLAEGIVEARQRNSPVLLALHYDTCGQCDRTRSQVFSDPEFVSFANEHCVVVVGQDPHDAGDRPHRKRPDGTCSLWPAISCAGHERIFEEGTVLTDGFRMSPGCFLLTPHAEPDAAPDARILVGEMDLPKSGQGTEVYLRRIEEAQKRLGPGLSRTRWHALLSAIDEVVDRKPGGPGRLKAAVAGCDPAIPLIADAVKILDAAGPADR